MADFCKECSEKLFGEDFGDLNGLCKEGKTTWALCEDCGVIRVDPTGKRILMDQVEDVVEQKQEEKGTYWYAFITDLSKNEQRILSHKHQKELKKALSEHENIEVHFIVKGKAYSFKVQKSFKFGERL